MEDEGAFPFQLWPTPGVSEMYSPSVILLHLSAKQIYKYIIFNATVLIHTAAQ